MATWNQTLSDEKKLEDKRVADAAAAQKSPPFTEPPAPVKPNVAPAEAHEARILAIEADIKTLKGRLDAAVLTPLAHDNRLTALEKLVRSHAETIGSVKTKP